MEIFNDLARAMKDHSNKNVKRALLNTNFELGTITSSGLKLDNFKFEIQDYLILDYLNLDENYFTDTENNTNVKTPKQLKPLNKNDRVLVVQVNTDFIIVGRIK